MGFLGTPLGWIMKFMYNFIHDYGLVLILFTLLTRLITFPLNVKQQKSSAKMALFQPKLQKLQKQYGKDKQRYQEEMMKLYEEEGYNPMSSCLPMLVQMVILFGIIDVVYRPLKHMLSIPADVITKATEALTEAMGKMSSSAELLIINIIQGRNTQYSADIFNGIFTDDMMEKIKDFPIMFMGFNMGEIPSFETLLWLIPVISGVTSLLVSVVSMRQQAQNMGEQQQGMGMMKGMMYIMPIFSTWIAFTLPSGVGLYWIISNIFSLVQTIVLAKVYSPEKMKAKVEAEMAEKKKNKKKNPSRYQQAMAAARAQQNGQAAGKPAVSEEAVQEEPEELTASQRIALARKRMAEKYGDEYDEPNDSKK